jgi:hypothetical protein
MNQHVIAKSIIILPAAFTQNSKTTSENKRRHLYREISEGGKCVCRDGSPKVDGECPVPKACEGVFCGYYASCTVGINVFSMRIFHKVCNYLWTRQSIHTVGCPKIEIDTGLILE